MAHVPAERCLGIIELLADGAREMPLGDIAERLVLPKSGAHRLLATLVDLGWAEQDRETGFYRLTMRLAVLGHESPCPIEGTVLVARSQDFVTRCKR